ncbi:MAG TPA: hypothetical protein VHW00_10145 [Thermoanaerobaculia bacterium]|nr:hypothetical protein [Thermoanaerobaculia bacterium]
MRVPIDQLGNDAHTWIFGISPALDAAQGEVLLQHVDAFLDQWASHGTPIRAARELREGSFLVIAADAKDERSGCSIDRMFGTLKMLEQRFQVQILDSNRVFLRGGDGVRAVPRNEFRKVATEETPVFDTTAETLGFIREGSWERRTGDSWHRHLL